MAKKPITNKEKKKKGLYDTNFLKPVNNLIISYPDKDEVSGKWYFVYRHHISGKVTRFEETDKIKCYKEYERVASIEVKEKIKKTKALKVEKKHVKLRQTHKPRGRFGNKEVTKAALETRLFETMKMLVEGIPVSEILITINKRFGTPHPTVYNDIVAIRRNLSVVSAETVNEIIKIHTLRYEILYKKFSELGYFRLSLKALKNKEALQGLHEEVVALQINNFGKELEVTYNTEKLDKSKMKELSQLMQKVVVITKAK